MKAPSFLFTALVLLTPAAQAISASSSDPAAAVVGLDQDAALRQSQSVLGQTVDDFTLLNRAGLPVRLSHYRGKPLLVSFIYTGCFQVCPLTTRSLQKALQPSLEAFGAESFNVVSVGFNQPADSPLALKSFALQHRIDAPNWDFLSPHASTVAPLTQAMGFSFVATPAGFDHLLQVTLLDAQGRVYRQLYGEELSPDALGEPLRQLLSNAPVTQSSNLADVLEQVRLLCTVYDPRTGRYRIKYDLLLEVAGFATFLIAVLWFFIGEWRSQRRARRSAGSPG